MASNYSTGRSSSLLDRKVVPLSSQQERGRRAKDSPPNASRSRRARNCDTYYCGVRVSHLTSMCNRNVQRLLIDIVSPSAPCTYHNSIV